MQQQQPKPSRYVKNAGAVFNLSYHIVFCPKYRRKVLVGDVEQRFKHILYATAQRYRVLIETMEVTPDHVHPFVTADPTSCVAEMVNRLKGASSRILRQEFPHLTSKLPTLCLRKIHQHIFNQRLDHQHKLARMLVNQYGLIFVEDLT